MFQKAFESWFGIKKILYSRKLSNKKHKPEIQNFSRDVESIKTKTNEFDENLL